MWNDFPITEICNGNIERVAQIDIHNTLNRHDRMRFGHLFMENSLY